MFILRLWLPRLSPTRELTRFQSHFSQSLFSAAAKNPKMPWGAHGVRGELGDSRQLLLWQWEYLSRTSRCSTGGTPGTGRGIVSMCHPSALLLLAHTCEHLHAPWSSSWSQQQSLPFASSPVWQSKHRLWQQLSKSHHKSGCPMRRSPREEEEQGATGAHGCLKGCWVKEKSNGKKKVKVPVPGCRKTDG